jgi:dihydrolipoamide dehydrogenase
MEPSKVVTVRKKKYDIVLVAIDVALHWIGFGSVGIPAGQARTIEVDEHFRTKVPSIYAIGDCNDGPMLAHKAEEEGIAAKTMAGFAGHVNYDAIPGTLNVCIWV